MFLRGGGLNAWMSFFTLNIVVRLSSVFSNIEMSLRGSVIVDWVGEGGVEGKEGPSEKMSPIVLHQDLGRGERGEGRGGEGRGGEGRGGEGREGREMGKREGRQAKALCDEKGLGVVKKRQPPGIQLGGL